jgi:hypothetical protein
MQAFKNGMGGLIAGVSFRLVRGMILGLPDSVLAVFMRGVRWLVYLITGDAMLRVALTDVMEIFQDGPPGTDTVRKMMREAELPLARDVVRGLMGI